VTSEQQSRALIGTVLDDSYRVDGLLGEGGMGAVYKATHLRLDKSVAIKVMARELASNPEALERFRREARVTSAIGHPHIVQVFDFSATPAGEPFLVMELLDGEDLDRRLRRAGSLPVAQVVRIVKQIASALAATHAKGIVHRDLKPGNVYLLEVAGERDFVKVLDFGISKVCTSATKLTRTAAIIGTPSYMSPEQANGNSDQIDEKTDQWALACIAWECLSGQGPFAGDTVLSILYRIVHEQPGALLQKVPGLDPQVEAVLSRALSKDKSKRFAGVDELAEAFERAAGMSDAVAASTPRNLQSPQTCLDVGILGRTTFSRTAGEVLPGEELPRSRGKKWIWALAATAVISLFVGVVLLRRPSTVHATIPTRPASEAARAAAPADEPVPSAAASISVPTLPSPPAPAIPAVSAGNELAPVATKPSIAKFRPAHKPATATVVRLEHALAPAPVPAAPSTTTPPEGPKGGGKW
jgi:serine/threonine-protein kinase